MAYLNGGCTAGTLTSLESICPAMGKTLREVLWTLYSNGGGKLMTAWEVSLAFECSVKLVTQWEKETGTKFRGDRSSRARHKAIRATRIANKRRQ